MSELKPHQQRVIQEKSDRDGELSRLSAFFDNPLFADAPIDEQCRMKLQAKIMSLLSDVLGQRIAAFSEPIERTVVSDNDGHDYVIPLDQADAWDAWLRAGDEDADDAPDYAERTDGGRVVFSEYRID